MTGDDFDAGVGVLSEFLHKENKMREGGRREGRGYMKIKGMA